jgi:hypothetical protein
MRCASELNGIIGSSRASGGSEEFVEAQAVGGLIENVGARNSTLEVVSPFDFEPLNGQSGGEAAHGWRDGRWAAASV